MSIADFPEINVASTASGSDLSKSAVVTVIPCHSMSLHHIAPVSCSLWATKRRSHWKRQTFQKLNEIDGAADGLMVLIWFNSSSLTFHNLLISLEANVDWKEPLPGQIRPDPPDELIMTKPLVDADGKVYGDFGHADRMHSLHCLSKSVKLHAIFFFACYGLICHGSEWLARVGQGSKADVWLECIHKGNGLASLATLNAAHSGKDPGTMMKYRAQAIHMIYPHIEDLYCILLKLDWRKFGDIESLICLMRACACTSCWNIVVCNAICLKLRGFAFAQLSLTASEVLCTRLLATTRAKSCWSLRFI